MKCCCVMKIFCKDLRSINLSLTQAAFCKFFMRNVLAPCRDVVDIDSLERTSMACPALPLCGLAVTEAERSLPDMLPRMRALLNRLGLEDLDGLVVRMTGALVFQLDE